MSDPLLVLSTSAISAYLRCHYAYLLGYVFRWKGEQSVAAAIGQAVHAGVEALHRGGTPLLDLEEAWRHEVASVPTAALDADPDAFSDALKMFGVYRQEVAPTFHPDLIEAPFRFQVAGVVVSGVIDNADTRTDDLRDTKTTAGKTINGHRPRFDPSRYDLQGGIYLLGYRFLTGRKLTRFRLDLLTRRGTHRVYDRNPSVGDALDAITVVRDGITREEFDPNGALSGACHWCSFASRCAYAILD